MEEALFSSAVRMAEAKNYNDWTFSLFQPYVTGSVLEVGSGVGSLTKRIIEKCNFDRLLAIDVSPEAVNHCRANLKHPFLDIECMDVKDVSGQFDTIICINVLEHIKDERAALKQMWESLKRGGTLFLLVPAHPFLFNGFDLASGHYRRYNKRDMRRMLLEVAHPSPTRLLQYHFNAVGALGYFFVYSLLRKLPHASVSSEVGFFDKGIVPLTRHVEGRWLPFGISLVSVATKD